MNELEHKEYLKEIEDTILSNSNLKNYSLDVLKVMKNECTWNYYSKNYIDKLLDPLILKKTRRAKLIRLNEIANEPELLEFFPDL